MAASTTFRYITTRVSWPFISVTGPTNTLHSHSVRVCGRSDCDKSEANWRCT
jgi:hypothetical protein